MLEKLAMDKHSILSQKFVDYRQKSFITLLPGSRKGWLPKQNKMLKFLRGEREGKGKSYFLGLISGFDYKTFSGTNCWRIDIS
jgi:hypothetical protein